MEQTSDSLEKKGEGEDVWLCDFKDKDPSMDVLITVKEIQHISIPRNFSRIISNFIKLLQESKSQVKKTQILNNRQEHAGLLKTQYSPAIKGFMEKFIQV